MTITKWERIFLSGSVIISILLCIVSFRLYEVSQEKVSILNEYNQYVANTSLKNVSATINNEPKYCIREENGRIKVFDKNEVYIILDNIDFRTLRKEDKERLHDGIYIYKEEEIQRFLEDFGS